MFKRIAVLLFVLSVPVLAQKPYRVLVMARTGDVIGGYGIARIGAEKQLGALNYEDFDAVQILGNDGPVFYARTDRGVAGIFLADAVMAVEGTQVGGVTISRIDRFRVGPNAVVWSAMYGRANCPGCLFKGVFVNKTLKLELKPTAEIIDMAVTVEGKAVTIARLAKPNIETVFVNENAWLKTGDVVSDVTLKGFIRGLAVGQNGLTIGIPVIYAGPKANRADGVLVDGLVFENISGMVGLTMAGKPITRAIARGVKDSHGRAMDQLLVDGVPFMTGIPGMDATVLSEKMFVVRTHPVGGVGTVTSSSGVEIDPRSLRNVPGLGSCCGFKGRPAINARGSVAFEAVSLDTRASAIVVVTTDPSMKGRQAVEPKLEPESPAVDQAQADASPSPPATPERPDAKPETAKPAKPTKEERIEKAADTLRKLLRR